MARSGTSQWSFQTKVLGILLGVSFLGAGAYVYEASSEIKTIKNAKKKTLQDSSLIAMDVIDRNLFERYGDVQAFALSEPARSMNPQRIVDFMGDMMPTYAPVYDLMIVANPEGKIIAVNNILKDGKPLPQSQNILGFSVKEETWFKDAIEGKIAPATALVDDPTKDAATEKVFEDGRLVMRFTAPIKNKETGAILGVWSNRMSWADVVGTISKEQSDKLKSSNITTIIPMIFGESGNLLLGPDSIKNSSDIGVSSEKLSGIYKDKKGTNWVQEFKIGDFRESGFASISPSLGYSSYPARNWTYSIIINESDAQQTATIFKAGIILLLIVASNIAAFFYIQSKMKIVNRVVGGLYQTSTGLAGQSREIKDSAVSLAESANEQAAALQETASALEETKSMIQKTSDNVEKSKSVAGQVSEAVHRGQKAISQVGESIAEIEEANNQLVNDVLEGNRKISEIVELVKEIGNKTKVINDIVFQTKLLSFNASVEAARAGEHGKGFAVVAEEVGNLANMSGAASKEISTLLDNSIGRVQSIVSDTQNKVQQVLGTAKTKVETGAHTAKASAEVLVEITGFVHSMVTMTDEIAQASKEQAHGVTEISKAMGQLDVVTQNNSQTSNSVSDSAVRLQESSFRLHKLVGDLSGEILGHGGHDLKTGATFEQEVSKPSPHTQKTEDSPEEEDFSKAA
jgi:methyl-accepting chemotaxis protein